MGSIALPGTVEWEAIKTGLVSGEDVTVDLETSGLDPFKDIVAGVAIRCLGESYYIPLNHQGLSARNVSVEGFTDITRYLHGRESIYHNAKFDIKFLILHYGCRPKIKTDTTVLAHFVDSNQKLGLKKLAIKYLGTNPKTFIEVAGSSKNACRVPVDIILPYACADVENTEGLYLLWRNYIDTQLHRLEIMLLEDFIEIEIQGVPVDVNRLAEIEKEYSEKVNSLTRELSVALGENINIRSNQQVGTAFRNLGIEIEGETATGQVSVSKKTLKRIDNGVVKKYLEFRKEDKVYSTYVSAIPRLLHNGCVHPIAKTVHTATGRFAYAEPNLQNQPKKGPLRSIYVARPGYYLCEADYSQVELRILASEAKAHVWLDAFRNGLDLHRYLASLMLGKKMEEITDDERWHSKRANFGIVYGLTKYGLSRELDISVEEADILLQRVFATDPAIKGFIERMIWEGRVNGRIVTKFGRVRPIPKENVESTNVKMRKHWEHICVNTKIQGTAADINKIGVHRLKEQGDKYGFRLLLTVHDSCLMEVPNTMKREDHQQIAREAMVFPIEGYCELKVDCTYGSNWGGLKEIGAEDIDEAFDFGVVKNCTACPVRSEATNPVPPQQVNGTPVMVVGRNPGKQEDLNGVPFFPAAPAGALFNEYLNSLGLGREGLWITNTLKCYTMMNRNPTPFERSFCADKWLNKEIEQCKPRVIITLGNEALRQVTGNEALHISAVNGMRIDMDKFVVLPLYHPAYFTRATSAKPDMFERVLPGIRNLLFEMGIVK
jgi:DNA polymerase-1